MAYSCKASTCSLCRLQNTKKYGASSSNTLHSSSLLRKQLTAEREAGMNGSLGTAMPAGSLELAISSEVRANGGSWNRKLDIVTLDDVLSRTNKPGRPLSYADICLFRELYQAEVPNGAELRERLTSYSASVAR